MIKNNIPLAIILEDDVISDLSNDEFWTILQNVTIPNDTDMFIFSGIITNGEKLVNDTYKFKRFMCTHFYLVTNYCAEILSQMHPIKYQIDSQISILITTNKINAYAYIGKPLAKQSSDFNTNIQNLNCVNCKTKDLSMENILSVMNGSVHQKNKWYHSKIFLYVWFIFCIALIIILIVVIYLYIKEK